MREQKFYRIITNAGYYYATTNGRYGRFDDSITRAWSFCAHHATENLPWMREANLEPRLILITDKMFCNQCDVNKRRR